MPPKIQIPMAVQQTINAFHLVNAYGNNASSSDSASYGHVVGMVEQLVTSGMVGAVTVYGLVTNPNWGWLSGQTVFLSDNGLSPTPPSSGFSQQLGKALNKTTIIFAPDQPVLL